MHETVVDPPVTTPRSGFWSRLAWLALSMFVVGTAVATAVLATDPTTSAAMTPGDALILPVQAAYLAALFCGVQSLLVAAFLSWWRARHRSTPVLFLVACLAAAVVVPVSEAIAWHPWTSPWGWDLPSWARGAAEAAAALAAIYAVAQAVVLRTRAWRRAAPCPAEDA